MKKGIICALLITSVIMSSCGSSSVATTTDEAIEQNQDNTSDTSSEDAADSASETDIETSKNAAEETSKDAAKESSKDDAATEASKNAAEDNSAVTDIDYTKVWGNIAVKEYVDDEYGIHFYLPSDLVVTTKAPMYNEGIVNRSYHVTGMGMNDEFLCQTEKCSDEIYNNSDSPEDEIYGEISHIDGYHYSINFIHPEYGYNVSSAMAKFVNDYRQKVLDSAWVDSAPTSSDQSDLTSESSHENSTAGKDIKNAGTTEGDLSIDEILALAKKRSGAPIADLDYIMDNGNLVIHLYEDMGDHTATWDWYEIDPHTLEGTDFMGQKISLK